MLSQLRCDSDEKFNSACKRFYAIPKGDELSESNKKIMVVFLCAGFDRDEPKGKSFILGQMVICFYSIVHIIIQCINTSCCRYLSFL